MPSDTYGHATCPTCGSIDKAFRRGVNPPEGDLFPYMRPCHNRWHDATLEARTPSDDALMEEGYIDPERIAAQAEYATAWEPSTPSDDAVQEAVDDLDADAGSLLSGLIPTDHAIFGRRLAENTAVLIAALAAYQREAADLRAQVERLEAAVRYAIEDGADLSDPDAASVYPTLFALAPQTAGECDE